MSEERLLDDLVADLRTEVRSFDTRAQIASVGYIFSLDVLGQIDARLPGEVPISTGVLIATWLVFITPMVQFGLVLYPDGPNIVKDLMQSERRSQNQRTLSERVSELLDAFDSQNQSELRASELLQLESVRAQKRRRFSRGLYLVALAYLGLALSQFLRIHSV